MFRQISLLFLSWRVILCLFALLIPLLAIIPPNSWVGEIYKDSPYLFWVWANFDGANFLDIARSGYTYPNFAYFPLFPLLISFIHRLTSLPFLESGLLISNMSFFLSLFVFYKIVLLDFNRKIVLRSIILLLAFPLSFFYGSVYTDSLYFLFSTLSFYFARKSGWFLAGFFGFLAGLSRLIGITLLLALVLEWYLQNKGKQENLQILFRKFLKDGAFWTFLVPLGLLTYSLYLQIYYGDFLLFQKAMAYWEQAKFIFPPEVFVGYLNLSLFLLVSKNIHFLVAGFELISTLFYFFLSLYVLKKIRLSYGVWMFTSLLIPIFTGTLQGMPRYILHLFPAFISLPLIFHSKRAFWPALIIFSLLQFIFVAFFTLGYFVA